MTKKTIATLIEQEVQQPTEGTDSSALAKPSHQGIATTQETQPAKLQLASQGLFGESKALWQEFIAFEKENQLIPQVSAQIWRVTKAVGKPALILSLKGIQTAFITVTDAEKRAALAERFSRSRAAQKADASLKAVED